MPAMLTRFVIGLALVLTSVAGARAQIFNSPVEMAAALEPLLNGCDLSRKLAAYFAAKRELERQKQNLPPLTPADNIAETVYPTGVVWQGQQVDLIQFEQIDNRSHWRVLVQFKADDSKVASTFFVLLNNSRQKLPPGSQITTGFLQFQGKTSVICQNSFGPWATDTFVKPIVSTAQPSASTAGAPASGHIPLRTRVMSPEMVAMTIAAYRLAKEQCDLPLRQNASIPSFVEGANFVFDDFNRSGKHFAEVTNETNEFLALIKDSGINTACGVFSDTLIMFWPAAFTDEGEWKSLVFDLLKTRKRYPPESVAAGEEGTAYVKIRVDRSGNVVQSEVSQSSGYPRLDDEALALVARTPKLPAPPVFLQSDTPVTLRVPVAFKIPESKKTVVVPPNAPAPPPPRPLPTAMAATPEATMLQVCNNTRRKAWMIVAFPTGDDVDEVPVKGWFEISARNCELIQAEGDMAHWFARTETGTWAGKERFYCVPEKKFQKVAYKGEKCSRGEIRVGTTMIELRPGATKTLNLNP